MNLQEICNSVCQLAKETGLFILNERKHFKPEAIEYKGKNDLVSYVDKTAEQKIVAGLLKTLPEAGFITEEKTNSTKGEIYNWVIDPLDGTTNFIHGVPVYCVSIGLLRNEKLVMGVIYEPNLEECFYAVETGAAFLNGHEIRVSAINKLEGSLLATGFPYTNYENMKPYMDVFDYCMRNTHGLRRMGSAAIDLAYVACGRFEGFYEYGLNPWDVAAGAFIIQQAGGKVADFSGNSDYIFGKEIVACNADMFDEFMEVIKKHFGKAS